MKYKALTSEINQIALKIGNKFLDVEKIQEVSSSDKNFIPYINAYPWDSLSTSHGYPAIILLFSILDNSFPNQGWDQASHIMIQQLINLIEEKGIYNSSLFSGLTGINFSILCASKNKTRYKSLIEDLNNILIDKIKKEYLNPWDQFIENNKFVPPLLWDLITGLSGVLPYLAHFIDNPIVDSLCSNIVDRLNNLGSSNMYFKKTQVPSFFTPGELLTRKDNQMKYKSGCIDTGIAHGISGILSTLSKVSILSKTRYHCNDAIIQISNWLKKNILSFNEKDIWPSRFVFSSKKEKKFEYYNELYRDGWCYGATGTARSLFLASKATKNLELKNFSLEVLKSSIERFPRQSGLKCPSFCHGFSGALTIYYSMFLDTNDERFLEISYSIAKQIINLYSHEHPFGYKTLASQGSEPEKWIDNPGCLDGTIGVVLSLLFFCSDRKPLWLDMFAI